MARKNNRRSRYSYGPARRTLTKSLDHTAGPPRAFSWLSDPGLDPVFHRSVRTPLIRTVLPEPVRVPQRSQRSSPVVSSRATGRSSDVQVRSPFRGAVFLTPQLTERAIACAKRGIRREVLFATKRTAKGSGSPRKPPSKWRC